MDKYKSLPKMRNVQNVIVKVLKSCPAVAYGITNNSHASDPQCWKKTERFYMNEVIKTI
jgi:hypothetical protein